MPTRYLDMNINKRLFDDQRQMRIRLETVAITMLSALIDDGQLSDRWSFVLDYENSRDPVPERREFVQFLSRCCETAIAPDESIRELARRLSENISDSRSRRTAPGYRRDIWLRLPDHM